MDDMGSLIYKSIEAQELDADSIAKQEALEGREPIDQVPIHEFELEQQRDRARENHEMIGKEAKRIHETYMRLFGRV